MLCSCWPALPPGVAEFRPPEVPFAITILTQGHQLCELLLRCVRYGRGVRCFKKNGRRNEILLPG
jgi:hypothetical protein